MVNLLKILRSLILRILNCVPISEYHAVTCELSNIRTELDDYKLFAESIYIYAGNYPAWKAQQEYRELLANTENALSEYKDKRHLSNYEYIDRYLGCIVDSFRVLIDKRPQMTRDEVDLTFWSSKRLSQARGDNYLISKPP